MGLRGYVYGHSKANTYIGGVSATITTASALATKLGISAGRVSDFKIVGSNIQAKITGGSYTLPSNVFFGSTAITYFDDRAGLVTVIAAGSFTNCSNLASVNFPNVTTITGSDSTHGPFQGCTILTSLSFPKWVSDATSKDYLFSTCTNLVSISAPLYNGKIGTHMFRNCSNFTTLGLSITGAVGINAFEGTKITTINLTNATTIGTDAFNDVTTLVGNISATNVTSISNNAFYNTRISGFDSASCTSIGAGGFYNCINLASVNFPNVNAITTTDSIHGTFQNTALTSISLPALTTITMVSVSYGYMFSGCTALTTINAPLYSGKIGQNMFFGCSSLTSINLNIVGPVELNAYRGTKITTVDLTNATAIGNDAFNGVTTLVGNISATNVASISNNAFYDTRISGFDSVSCANIAAGAFYNCINLASVNFPNVNAITTTDFIHGTFQNTALTSISLPALTTLTISSGSFGYLFSGCTAINSISMPLVSSLGAAATNNNIFLNIKTGCSITVPVALQTINAGAPDADLVYAVGTRGATVTYV